jgi:hypothetical protein
MSKGDFKGQSRRGMMIDWGLDGAIMRYKLLTIYGPRVHLQFPY